MCSWGLPVRALLMERRMETLERLRNVAMESTPALRGGTGWLVLLLTGVLAVLTRRVVGSGLMSFLIKMDYRGSPAWRVLPCMNEGDFSSWLFCDCLRRNVGCGNVITD